LAGAAKASVSREIALEVLQAVEKGLFAEQALGLRLEERTPSREDRRLATELVYGVLRWRSRLDAIISRCLVRPDNKLDPKLRDILRIGLYQLLFLDRIPAPAAVDQAVVQAKSCLKGKAPSLVNATLRRIIREKDNLNPSPGPGPQELASYYSHPLWLVKRWLGELGYDTTIRVLAMNNSRASLVVRVNRIRTTPEELLSLMAGRGIEAHPVNPQPDALRIRSGGRAVGLLPGFREGLFSVQDGASQLVAPLLAPRPGERILDACAAPGGKAAHIAALTGNDLELVATDSSETRLREMERNLERLGVTCVTTVPGDVTNLEFIRSMGTFDRILLDAACSNLGVLRHNPEARYRIQRRDPASFAAVQLRMLEAVASALRPGGLLVYSVCTVTREETTEVVSNFVKNNSTFRLIPIKETEVWRPDLLDASGCLRTFPSPEGESLDGFFGARLRGLSDWLADYSL